MDSQDHVARPATLSCAHSCKEHGKGSAAMCTDARTECTGGARRALGTLLGQAVDIFGPPRASDLVWVGGYQVGRSCLDAFAGWQQLSAPRLCKSRIEWSRGGKGYILHTPPPGKESAGSANEIDRRYLTNFRFQ